VTKTKYVESFRHLQSISDTSSIREVGAF